MKATCHDLGHRETLETLVLLRGIMKIQISIHSLLPLFFAFGLAGCSLGGNKAELQEVTVGHKKIDVNAPAQKNISGNWKTDPVVRAGGLYLSAEYRLTINRFELVERYSTDSMMQNVVMVVRSEGTYTLQERTKETGSYDLDLTFTKRFMKATTQRKNVLPLGGFVNCSLRFNEEKDMSDDACGPYESISRCETSFHTLAIEDQDAFAITRAFACSPASRAKTPDMVLKQIF